ncbi:MAG: ATP:cob(I)alamin adenosyltransferase [Erysipelotrichaceae bacterium]|jgi:ATP:cob(I)alamin adenosyltransferase|nr:ATP:cob(I)alamin adenosyltransferase [Erysipelothrix sp.]MCD8574156.1 ATP:cob(I)alamin adenosyltransferase [Erysipelotrichaceae bacterium]
MKVMTKTGDQGHTGVKNARVEKDSSLVDCIGHLDEAMAFIIYNQSMAPDKLNEFKDRHKELSLIASIVAGFVDESEFTQSYIDTLETRIKEVADSCNGFVWPFDDPYRARLNVLRTIIRRLERVMIRAFKEHGDRPLIRIYINRLSDYIFILINQ